MQKGHAFNILSEEKFCAKCGRPLKRGVAEEQPKFHLFYKCFKKIEAKRKEIPNVIHSGADSVGSSTELGEHNPQQYTNDIGADPSETRGSQSGPGEVVTLGDLVAGEPSA